MTRWSIYSEKDEVEKCGHIFAKTAALPSIPTELIDQFVCGPRSADAVNEAPLALK